MKPNETISETLSRPSSVNWILSGFGPQINFAPEGDPSPIVPPVPPAAEGVPPPPATPPVAGEPVKEPGSLLDKKEPVVEPVAVEPLTLDKIKLPEGFTIDDSKKAEAEAFLGVLNDSKLDAAGRASALIDMYAKATAAGSEKATSAWNDLQTDWQKECQSDPDIGGVKLEPALGQISGLLDEYGSPELRGVFNITGAGNNPHMVKFLAKVATALGEGKPAPGTTPVADRAPLADRLYPSMKKG